MLLLLAHFPLLAQSAGPAASSLTLTQLVHSPFDIQHCSSIYELIDLDNHCKVISFQLVRIPADKAGERPQCFSSGDNFNEQILELLAKVKAGDWLLIEELVTEEACIPYDMDREDGFLILASN